MPSAERPERPPRADARRNAARVLTGARQAVAAHGLDVSYHEIARRAGVGVGTVYRRYPERGELMEAVLLDLLGELTAGAERALSRGADWPAFTRFFTDLALRTGGNAGLSASLDDRGGPRVAAARRQLLELLRRLTERAQRVGTLRPDLCWYDLPFLAKAATSGAGVLDLSADPRRAERCIRVVLDGMRPPAAGPGQEGPAAGPP
ncbi:TetR/AcrR family transcriptional regulator [Streptomyces sp. NPDC048636]|uniref:TetR/AcrR family transcriptional regulator n=1 Tax=Streptomyces sp. NPDC048636 TaxID=3155762 RepID=UPI003439EE4D